MERNRELGERLQRARKAAALSQASVCASLKWSTARLKAYEKGTTEPGISELERLAAHYGVAPAQLAFGAYVDQDTVQVSRFDGGAVLRLPTAVLGRRPEDTRAGVVRTGSREARVLAVVSGQPSGEDEWLGVCLQAGEWLLGHVRVVAQEIEFRAERSTRWNRIKAEDLAGCVVFLGERIDAG